MLANILYMEFSEIAELGLIKADSLKHMIRRKNANWVKVKDPADGRKVLIQYEALRPKYKAAIEAKFGNPYVYVGKQLEQAQETKILTQVGQLFKDCNRRILEGMAYGKQPILYPEWYINEVCQQAAWYDFILGIKSKKDAKIYGCDSKQELLELCLLYWQEGENSLLKKINNLNYLSRKLRVYKKKGIAELPNKKYGNSNRLKVTGESANYLLQLACQANKFNHIQIHALYKIQAKLKGWDLLNESTVFKWLNKPENKQLVYMQRHGNKAFNNAFEMTMSRQRVSQPHALWVMDGSPMELYYKGDKKPERIYCFMVVDAHSWAIVGAAFGKTETQDLVFDAIRDAARRTGVLAEQLQFDNSSAIKAHDMMAWYKSAFKHAFPARVGNARAKMVEPLLKQFNEQVLRFYGNYSGAGITAKNINNRLNDEHVKKHWRKFPDRGNVIDQLTKAMFTTWNGREIKKYGASPDEMLSIGNPNARRLELLDMVSIFWKFRMQGDKKRSYQYQQKGLEITIGGKRFQYEVRGADDLPDYDFWRKNAGLKFNIKYDPQDLSMVALYDKDGKQIAIAQSKWFAPHAIADYKEGDAKRLKAMQQKRDNYKKGLKKEAAEKGLESIYQITDDFKVPMAVNGVYKDKQNQVEGDLKLGLYNIPVAVN